jgi:FSR family fosmidomycin resistance protein-like MFS transporter
VEKIPLLLIFLGHVWVDASQGILPVVLPKLKDVFALDYFQVGMMMTVLNVTSSVIQPLFGYISDRIRTGWFVPVGILWTALAMGLLGWMPSYQLALLLVGLAGLGTAAFHPRAMMAVSLISGTRRGLATAVFSTGGNLGFALGPVVGGFLVLGLGLRATLGLLVPGILLSLVLYFYPADFLKRGLALRTNALNSGDREPLLIPWIPLVAVCLIVTLRSWVYISSVTYLPMILEGRGIDLKTGSLMLTVFLVGGAAAGLYGGHLSDRLGRRRVIAVSMLLYPLCMTMFLQGSGIWLWILAGTSGAALLASFAVTIVLAQELLPHHLGLASGLILGLGFGMGGLGTALSGYLADVWGLSTTAWILAFAPLSAAFMTTLIKVPPASHRESFA